MSINHENLRLVVGSRAYEVPDLVAKYEMLMRVLHGEDFTCSDEAFDELLKSQSEVLVFIIHIHEGSMLATAQVSLINTFPRRQAIVNNVVVDPKYQGLRLGKVLMARVLQEAEAKWRNESGLRIWLTNSPDKGNAGFYEKLGFSPRTVESGDLTVVWEVVT
jgi:GNAT superfamily N-acetyltransferase